MKTKEILINFVKNAISYALPVMMIQFIIQPIIASKLGAEDNGLYLTIIASIYFFTSITSSTLMQVRLLKDADYKNDNIIGDFNLLIIVFSLLSFLTMTILSLAYIDKDVVLSIILNGIVSILYLIQNYICVSYRLDLNYSKILFSNIFLCVGYAIGTVVFYSSFQHWQIIFIISYVTGIAYDLFNTNVWKEKITVTPLFKSTITKYLLLAGAGCLSYLVSYGDRIILYPLTDGTSVSIYTSAQIVGKLLMLLSAPLSSFFMAYIVRMRSISIKIKKKYFFYVILIIVFLYIGCNLISYPLLHLLYPDWANDSISYVPLTVLTSLCNLLSSIINVVLIRFCHSKMQLVVNGTYLLVYLFFSFILLYFFGLIGYCIGDTFSSLFKVILIIYIISKNRKKIFDIS